MFRRARNVLCEVAVAMTAAAVLAAPAGAGDYTYYVGSAGSWGTVHYEGTSNGHRLIVVSNALRFGTAGCGDIWVNGDSGRISASYNGICAAGVNYLLFQDGYHNTGVSWCDGHTQADYYTNIQGRCQYHWVEN
jgi:hypothetical protein